MFKVRFAESCKTGASPNLLAVFARNLLFGFFEANKCTCVRKGQIPQILRFRPGLRDLRSSLKFKALSLEFTADFTRFDFEKACVESTS